MKKNDYIVILAPMVTELKLQGNALLIFAMIHGFTKDGEHKFIGSFQYIADWLNISERSVKEVVGNLIKDGYLNKTQELNDRRRPINVYTTNYDDLVARAAAGEEVKPSPIVRRGVRKNVNSAENAPLVTTIVNGGESDNLMVQNFPFNGAKNAHNNYSDKYIDNNSLSESAHAREAEEREFFKIFFLNNAADPAAEVKRFVGYYQSKGWMDAAGRSYDTAEKRAGLAYGWDCKSGERLSRGESTDKFYKFLSGLYSIACASGGIDPMLLFDLRGGYKYSDGTLLWDCTSTVQKWFESLGKDMCRGLLDTHFGVGCKLFYCEVS